MSETTVLQDPKNTTSYRLVRAAVILLGVLLIIAFVTLVVGLALRMSGHGPGAVSREPARFTLAPGAKIVGMASEPGRLILRIRAPAGDEIDIIDTASGQLVGQVKSAPEPK